LTKFVRPVDTVAPDSENEKEICLFRPEEGEKLLQNITRYFYIMHFKISSADHLTIHLNI
jgi:hypothetical protein